MKRSIKHRLSIVSLDHIDLIQSIGNKLRMIELFFTSNQSLADKVVFLLLIKQFNAPRRIQ